MYSCGRENVLKYACASAVCAVGEGSAVMGDAFVFCNLYRRGMHLYFVHA